MSAWVAAPVSEDVKALLEKAADDATVVKPDYMLAKRKELYSAYFTFCPQTLLPFSSKRSDWQLQEIFMVTFQKFFRGCGLNSVFSKTISFIGRPCEHIIARSTNVDCGTDRDSPGDENYPSVRDIVKFFDSILCFPFTEIGESITDIFFGF